MYGFTRQKNVLGTCLGRQAGSSDSLDLAAKGSETKL